MSTREKRIMSSSAAEAVANVEELLTQILETLPFKSLARFKCVSTHWLSLISNLRTLKNRKITAFFSSKIQGEFFTSIPSPLGNHEIPPGWNPFKTLNNAVPDGSELRILQSCNGLFLCHVHTFGKHSKHHPIYVVNPTINQFRPLSSPSVGRDTSRDAFVPYALAFDPSKSPHYKVVCVTHAKNTHLEGAHHKIDIYSSETEKWKKQYAFGYDLKNHFDRRSSEIAVYCNGAVHWIRKSSEVRFLLHRIHDESIEEEYEFIRQETDMMHYYDLEEGCLRFVSATPPIPLVVKNIPVKFYLGFPRPSEFPGVVQRYFGESGGHLYLIETYKHCNTQFDVMELQSDYSGWFVKHHVDLNPLFAALPGPNWISGLAVLCLSQEKETYNGVEEDSSCELWLHIPGKVLSYNLRNHTLTTFIELANKENLLASPIEFLRSPRPQVVMFPYSESLTFV